MGSIEILVIIFAIFIITNKLLISKKIFIDPKGKSNHKSFLKKNEDIPFSGGILILISNLIFLPYEYPYLNFFLILVFVVGLLSDLEIVKSPTKRIIFQTLVILTYLIISNNLIQSTRIQFIDNLFEVYYVRLFFTIFCILVLINGSNFIDGVNTLAATYFMMVLGIIMYLKYNYYLESEIFYEKIIFLSLFVFLIFNFFGKVYLGDNGAYLLSFIVGVNLIELQSSYITISPYFIICLLWYPAYENLFSIIRKKIQNFSPSKPDIKHFHQLLFIFLKKKMKLDSKFANTFTGIVINSFNLVVFLIAVPYHYNTKILLLILIINVLIYNSLYFFLKKNYG